MLWDNLSALSTLNLVELALVLSNMFINPFDCRLRPDLFTVKVPEGDAALQWMAERAGDNVLISRLCEASPSQIFREMERCPTYPGPHRTAVAA